MASAGYRFAWKAELWVILRRVPADGSMLLPSEIGGETTAEVGFFELGAESVARWLAQDSEIESAEWHILTDAVTALASRSPSPLMRAVVPVEAWSVVLTSGPHGTDVGMLPSLAARDLSIRAIRAVASTASRFPGHVLELFGPDGTPPLNVVRSIAAINDGGRWVFETSGEPLEVERLAEYERPRARDRLTGEYLYELLRALGVPCDTEPRWREALIVGG